MKRLIQITISIILLGLLVYWTDLNQVQKSLAKANYFYLLVAIGIVTLNRFLMAWKWGLLLKAKNIKIKLFDLTKIYYIANYLGLVLPPTVGADIVRGYYLIRKGNSQVNVIASIFVERIIGFLCLFFSALVGFILFLEEVAMPKEHADKLLTVILILSIGGTILFLLSLNDSFADKMLGIVKSFENNHLVRKIVAKLEKFIEAYKSYKNHKAVLFTFLLLTFIEIFTVILWSYVVSVALNLNVSFTYFIAFVPVLTFLVRLPFTIDGFGLNEGGFVYFLALVGITSSVALSAGLITHIVTIIGILPGGIFYAFNREAARIKPKELQINENQIADGNV